MKNNNLKIRTKISALNRKNRGKKMTYEATLRDKTGKRLVNEMLEFKYKGNSYKRHTNKNGVAKVELNINKLGPGDIAIVYKGSHKYAKTAATRTITDKHQRPSHAKAHKKAGRKRAANKKGRNARDTLNKSVAQRVEKYKNMNNNEKIVPVGNKVDKTISERKAQARREKLAKKYQKMKEVDEKQLEKDRIIKEQQAKKHVEPRSSQISQLLFR